MKEIICKKCGAIYISNDVPLGMRCTCEATKFEVVEEAIA